jgi:hypothetical protein
MRSKGIIRVGATLLAAVSAVMLGRPAVDAGASAVGGAHPSSAGAQARLHKSARAQLAQGGTFICSYPSGNTSIVETSILMNAGTSGAISADPNGITGDNNGPPAATTSCTIGGVIPSGWSVSEAVFPISLSGGNAGTLTVSNSYFSNSLQNYFTSGPSNISGDTFQNEGTFTVAAGGTYSVNFGIFTNLPGGIVNAGGYPADSLAGGALFGYDSGTTPGTFTNEGTVNASSQGLAVGPVGCSSGVDFVLDAGSTVNVSSGASFSINCGALAIDGGNVIGGPISAKGPATPLSFGSAVPTGSTGTINLIGNTALSGTIAPGWTVSAPYGLHADSPAGNAGTLQFISGSTFGIVDTEGFTNSGSITVQSASININTPDFVNTATGSISISNSSSKITFRYDNPVAPGTATNDGTINIGAGTSLQVGNGGCAKGVTFSTGSGSTLDSQGNLDEVCGTLDLNGGTFTGNQPLQIGGGASSAVNFDAGLTAGTGTAAETVDLTNPNDVVEGTIPQGWEVSQQSTTTIEPGTTNDGMWDLLGGTVSDSGRFTNAGTFTTAGSGGGVLDIADVVNTGTFDSDGSNTATLDFGYGAGSSAGVIDNFGTMTVAAGNNIQIGGSGCQAGEDLTLETGSTIAATGTFLMACGNLDVKGGTVTAAGPVFLRAGGPLDSVTFAPGLPAGTGGAGDTLLVQSSGPSFTNYLPAGWTLDETNSAYPSAPDGFTNDGTIVATGGGLVNDPGSFVNNGTIEVTSGSVGNTELPTFLNTGTVTIAANQTLGVLVANTTNDGAIDIGGNADFRTAGFTQSPGASLGITVNGGYYGQLVAGANAALGGELAITTTGAPSNGATLAAVEDNTQSSQFAYATGENAGGGLAYNVAYATNRVNLGVVSTAVIQSLAASAVTLASPASPYPGQTVTGSFTVTNTGTGTAKGAWYDSVYIGSSPAYQTGDKLLERINGFAPSGGLPAGQSYTDQISAALPTLAPGTYYLIAVPDSDTTVSPDFYDQQATSAAFTVAPVPTLTPGTPVTVPLTTNGDLYYQVHVSPGTDVRLSLTLPGGSSNAAVYAEPGTFASSTVYEITSAATATAPAVVLPSSTPGTWYVDVHAWSLPSGSSITIDPENEGLAVTHVTPGTSGTSGPVTVTITGSGFGPDLTAKLTAGAATILPMSLTRVSSTTANATFEMAGEAAGEYGLTVSSGGNSASLANALNASQGASQGNLEIEWGATPQDLRYGWIGLATLIVTNVGGSDVSMPEVTVASQKSSNGSPLALVTDESNLTCPLSGGAGDCTLTPGKGGFGPSVTLLDPVASVPGQPPMPAGILPPGETETFTFGVISNTVQGGISLPVDATVVNSTDNQPINWNTLLAAGKPAGMTPNEWEQVIQDVILNYGQNEGSYARAIVPLITEARAEGVAMHSDDDVLGFLLEKAIRTGGPVGGVVTDTTTGAPLAGATVTFTDPNDATQSDSTTTWYDGTYSFYGVPAGTYDVSVAGHLPRSQQETVAFNGTLHADLAVTDGATLTGTVTETGGSTPIAGATVNATDADGTVTATTGADGSYTITGLEPGSVDVAATASGYVDSPDSFATVAAGSTATDDISLDTAGAVSGTIAATGGGNPPAGTTVEADSSGGGAGVQVATNTNGTFTINGLEPGTYSVTASAPGAGAITDSGVTVSSGLTASVGTLTLAQPATLSGTITDSASGAAIADAMVSSDAAGAPAAVTTAANGTYTIAGLPAGAQGITVLPPDATHTETQLTVTLTGGSTTTQNVTLDPTGNLSATVQSSPGSPLADVLVDLVGPSSSTGPVSTQSLETNSSGVVSASSLLDGTYDLQIPGSDVHQSFTVSNSSLSPNITLTVPVATVTGKVVDASGNAMSGVPVSLIDTTGAVGTTTTHSSGAYSFYVTGLASADVVAASASAGVLVASGVSASPGTTTTVPNLQAGSATLSVAVSDVGGVVSGAVATLSSGSAADSASAAVVAATDNTGTASFSNLTPGTYRLLVADGTDAPLSETVTVSSGANQQTVSLAPGGAITGTIAAGGQPVEAASVVAVANAASTPSGQATTAADGTYTIAGLAPGTYSISINVGGDVPAVVSGVQVTAGSASTANATLSTTGSTLTVDLAPDSSGNPLPNATVEVVDATGNVIGTAGLGGATAGTDSSATGTIGPLAAGSYTMQVTSGGRATANQAVTVASGGTTATVDAPSAEALSTLPAATILAGTNTSGTLRPGTTQRRLPAGGDPGAFRSAADIIYAWVNGGLIPPAQRDPNDQSITAAAEAALALAANGCNGPQLAALQAQLRQYLRAKDRIFDQWAENNAKVAHLSGAYLLELGAEASGALGSLYLAVLSLPYLLSSIPAVAGAVGVSVEASQAIATLSAGTSAAGLFSEIVNAAQSGNFTAALADMNTLSNAVSVLTSFIKEKYDKVPGLLGLAFSQIATARSLFQDLTNAGAQLENIAQEGRNDESAYYKLLGLIGGLTDQVNGVANGPCPPNPPPPNPPPPPPPNQTNFTNNLGLDPNALNGTPGAGTQHWVLPRSTLSYTVQFQNEPKATASVAQVVVTDKLPTGIDPTSVQLTAIGFGPTSVVVPAGLQSVNQTIPDAAPNGDGDNVEVSGSYNHVTSTITWTLSAINPVTGGLDASAKGGFLPPDNSKAAGEGYVSFTARLLSGLPNATAVTDKATITFDRNAPISTPAWTNTVDAVTPAATVAPLAAETPAGALPVSWSGTEAGGPGIHAYNVYVSVNGGHLALWQAGITATSATYPTITGSTYAFAAQAIDSAGAVGAVPAKAQTTTKAIPGYRFVPVTPVRLFDTRAGTDGVKKSPVGPGQSIVVKVASAAGLPSSGVAAVALNVTGIGATKPTVVTAWADGKARPGTATLNLSNASAVSDLAIVPVGADGKVDFYNSAGSLNLFADVAGYFTAAGGYAYVPLAPARLFDTRTGTDGVKKAPVGAGKSIAVKVEGSAGLPGSGVAAVAFNVTGIGATKPTAITAWADGKVRPATVTLSVSNANAVSDLAIVPVGADGKVDFYNSAGSVNLFADVAGYFTASGGYSYVPLAPVRLFDTRTGSDGVKKSPVGPGQSIGVKVAGAAGLASLGVVAVAFNVTGISATKPTVVTAWADGKSRPGTATLNLSTASALSDLDIAPVAADGKVDFYNSAGSVNLFADIAGYFTTGVP